LRELATAADREPNIRVSWSRRRKAYVMTTSRMTSGELSKSRNGLVDLAIAAT